MTDLTITQYPVLVYGTLRPGGSNYGHFLGGATIAEKTVTLDGYTMYGDSGCPFLAVGDRTVVATLVTIEPEFYDEIMWGLDRLEGFRDFGHEDNNYDRKLVTFTVDGVESQAWIYTASKWLLSVIKTNTPVLESGDWIEHMKAQDKVDLDFVFAE